MKVLFLAILLPLAVFAEPVPELDYYWEQPTRINLGFSAGVIENAPAFGAEMLFPAGNLYLRPALYLTAKDDKKFSWFYPSFDLLLRAYGNDRTSMRFFVGIGAHMGVCIKDDRRDVSSAYGGQILTGFDYTLSRTTSAFLELGGQGSYYTLDGEDENHVGAYGKVGIRFTI
ncbi:hypothetical protein JW890_08745 [candidate division WOR-3 bacterium]|nr:hypothetical protein [candidate division WOR-3 bacterium]